MPAWSPDGQWVAFNIGSHIFKMRFTGEAFDTTSLTQLTLQGRNFFPAWSPDGQWIAYNKSICEGPNTCGIWLMSSNGGDHQFVTDYGNYPDWNRSGSRILYRTRAVTEQGYAIGDTLWLFDLKANRKSYLVFLGGRNNDNRYPRYSPDGTKIAFWSSSEDGKVGLWWMNADGTQVEELVPGGGEFSWSSDGTKIVLMYSPNNGWTYQDGTLWVFDLSTQQLRQLTSNR